MFLQPNDVHYSFAYHYSNEPLTDEARIVSIGFEKRISTDYYWDGRMRKNDHDTCIFQYTLSGFGKIQAGSQTLTVHPGEAFMVKVPSDHCYYLPSESTEWEFLFITLKGPKAEECWDYIINQFGLKIVPGESTQLLLLLQKIYHLAVKEGIEDTFIASAKAYEFIMGLYRFAKGMDQYQSAVPEDLCAAAQFMESHYADPLLSLDKIAQHAGLSKYYFANKFQKHMKTTPIQFLTKIRMQKAVELLLTTEKTLEEIASETGYDNANYFSKVFKKIIGLSADSFRKDKKMTGFQHVILD